MKITINEQEININLTIRHIIKIEEIIEKPLLQYVNENIVSEEGQTVSSKHILEILEYVVNNAVPTRVLEDYIADNYVMAYANVVEILSDIFKTEEEIEEKKS